MTAANFRLEYRATLPNEEDLSWLEKILCLLILLIVGAMISMSFAASTSLPPLEPMPWVIWKESVDRENDLS